MMTDVIHMRRRGHKLEAATAYDGELLELLPEGVSLNVRAAKARSIPFNGMYWAGLHKAVENLPDKFKVKFPTADKVHKALLIGCGYVETVWTFAGVPAITPDSTRFSKMSAHDFRTYFEMARPLLAKWLGWDVWEEQK